MQIEPFPEIDAEPGTRLWYFPAMTQLGTIAAIWRYPVKSLAPQSLETTRIDESGLPGDRTAALIVGEGHARIGKPYRGKEHNLLHLTDSAQLAAALANERGVQVRVESADAARYFDAAPVSLIFDRWVAEVESALDMQLDAQRWRPNLFVTAAAGFHMHEADLTGEILEAGSVVLRVRKAIKRCVVPTYDLRTGESLGAILDYVAQQRDNVMGVYCDVEVAGTLRAGDDLRLRAR